MANYARTKLFITILLLFLFAIFFGYPAVTRLLDDENVFIEDKSDN